MKSILIIDSLEKLEEYKSNGGYEIQLKADQKLELSNISSNTVKRPRIVITHDAYDQDKHGDIEVIKCSGFTLEISGKLGLGVTLNNCNDNQIILEDSDDSLQLYNCKDVSVQMLRCDSTLFRAKSSRINKLSIEDHSTVVAVVISGTTIVKQFDLYYSRIGTLQCGSSNARIEALCASCATVTSVNSRTTEALPKRVNSYMSSIPNFKQYRLISDMVGWKIGRVPIKGRTFGALNRYSDERTFMKVLIPKGSACRINQLGRLVTDTITILGVWDSYGNKLDSCHAEFYQPDTNSLTVTSPYDTEIPDEDTVYVINALKTKNFEPKLYKHGGNLMYKTGYTYKLKTPLDRDFTNDCIAGLHVYDNIGEVVNTFPEISNNKFDFISNYV